MSVNSNLARIKKDSLELLRELIRIPSFSGFEDQTATTIGAFLSSRGIVFERHGNNILAKSQNFSSSKPTILLNSHHDTVKPVSGWTIDPFQPIIENEILFGLGSNDAGASLVSLISTFCIYYKENLSFNLILCASAEEENSGKNGIESLLPFLDGIVLAIVGEPTGLNVAISEKGLLVLDCTVNGVSGHAAREEGDNALYKALPVIQWFQKYEFEKKSDWLGPVKMTVTQIQSGTQHNVVPDKCYFTVDVRLNEHYSHEMILEEIQNNVQCEIKPRSTRLKASTIEETHPAIVLGKKMKREIFGSSTMSDRALLPFPSVKVGPGLSERSHTANEFIHINELNEGIEFYIDYLDQLNKHYSNETLG